ncbi:MAG: non-ribosomal peptide synthetase [Gemmatimonadales bacterium]|nr:non-ribosomal peptide synthetase [Gemmatimonadales bacterium]
MSLTARSRRPPPRAGFVPFDRAALEGSIPRRFEQQADAHPGRLAVKFGEAAWTYHALERAANRVARALPGFPRPHPPAVVLLIAQGPALVVAILGVLKAGGFYVPLETSHAPGFVATVANEARASLVLADAGGAALAAEAALGIPVIRVDELLAGGDSGERLGIAVAADAPAYIYYTSGSTGRPKGVADSHRNVLHNVMRYTNSLGIDRDDRLTLLQSPSFSGAVSSLFGALLNGAATFPYDLRRLGAAGLGGWLVRERISIYHSVPALFRLAAESAAGFPDLRLIRLEGDRMSRRDWIVFRARFPEGCVLVNGLGATECGLVRQFFIDPAMPLADGVVPIGYPVEDMDVRVVDEVGRPVDVGQVGEIAVRSRYLAIGYHGRPDLTASAFPPDPSEPGIRTYRTGDLGRMQPDGCLDHLGRRDARRRIRGQWVDLAEVEAALLGAAGVGEAAAQIYAGTSDEPRLVAYIVPRDGVAPAVGALRAHLAARLPGAAVPAVFVMLAHLPLTEHGKVDRAALPPPSPERPDLGTEFVAPRTGLERTIAAIWCDVLHLERVGVHDTFFDLGGDSLALSRVHGRLQLQLGAELSIVALFEHPTIYALAGQLDPRAASTSPLVGVQARADRMSAAARAFRAGRPTP